MISDKELTVLQSLANEFVVNQKGSISVAPGRLFDVTTELLLRREVENERKRVCADQVPGQKVSDPSTTA